MTTTTNSILILTPATASYAWLHAYAISLFTSTGGSILTWNTLDDYTRCSRPILLSPLESKTQKPKPNQTETQFFAFFVATTIIYRCSFIISSSWFRCMFVGCLRSPDHLLNVSVYSCVEHILSTTAIVLRCCCCFFSLSSFGFCFFCVLRLLLVVIVVRFDCHSCLCMLRDFDSTLSCLACCCCCCRCYYFFFSFLFIYRFTRFYFENIFFFFHSSVYLAFEIWMERKEAK